MSSLAAEPNRILDCRNLACPLPVVKTAQAIKDLESGEHLLVLATDPGFAQDIKAWSSRTGNDLVAMTEEAGAYQVLLKRT